MTIRRFFVKVHQYTGLTAAVFLVVIGLSGSLLAFEADYDRWLNPALWRVNSAQPRMSEQALVDFVQHQFGDSVTGARVAQIDMPQDDLAQVFELTSGLRVYVDPYSGRVTGARRGRTELERFLLNVRIVHTRLFAGERGRWTVDVVSVLVVLLLVPIGVYLWWNKRRATVAWRASWKRINWDLHSAVGIYAAAFVIVLAGSGVFMGYEAPLYWLIRSAPEESPRLPRSSLPTNSDRAPIARANLDSLLARADAALPRARTVQVVLPLRPRSVFQVFRRGGSSGTSSVALDQYSGRVLLVDDFARASRALRARTIDQAVHLG
ncbi:MAG TPA: PepSY-associated TM helix domain-containing protein, partial [Gemmatimonadaceae bacterium]